MSKPAMGIYAIYNPTVDAVYIGSSVDVNTRLIMHRMLLRGGRHYNRRLQGDWLTYGEPTFTYHMLEAVRRPGLLEKRESHWIAAYRRSRGDRLYNVILRASRACCPVMRRHPNVGYVYQNGPVLYLETIP